MYIAHQRRNSAY